MGKSLYKLRNNAFLLRHFYNFLGGPDMPVGFSSALQQTVIYQSGIRAPQQALPYALASADFDGDGNDDLIISTIEEAGVLFARGFPNGTFASPFIPIIPRSVFSLHDLCQIDMTVGDFNGDGKPDIALSNLVASGNCGEGVTQTAQSLKIYTFLNIMAWPTTTTSVTSSSTTMFELTNTTSSSTTSTPTTETHTTSSPTTETPTTSMPTTDTPPTSALSAAFLNCTGELLSYTELEPEPFE